MFKYSVSRSNLLCFVAAFTLLAWSELGSTQTQSKAATLLNDAQAQVLMMQMLSAQGGGGSPLSPAQTQMLLEYMQAKNGSASLSASGTLQTQMMVQDLAAQARRLPGAPGASAPMPAGLALAPATAPATTAVIAPLGEKKPGITRIGITMPQAQLGPNMQGPAAGEPLRSMLQQYLAGPSVEVTLITALLPDQIEAEGKSKQCDFLVYSSIVQKKQTGGMGMLRSASSYANMIPMIGMANGMGGAIAAAGAASAMSQAATLSSSVKAKGEVSLEYRLNSVGSSTPAVSKTLNAKASTDGEDVITPLVEQAATVIMAEVGKKH